MTLYDVVYEALQDRVESGEITLEEAQILNEMAYDRYMTEGMFSKSPLKDTLENLKKIKDAKPDEYSDEEEVKEFVDKHYNDLVKTAELLEKEPEELSKNEKNYLVSLALAIIAFVAGAVAGGGVVTVVLMGASFAWIYIGSIIVAITSSARTNADIDSMKQLTKIKKALKNIKTDKIPESYQKKIKKLIEKINDAETDIYSKLKEVKEAVEAEDNCGEIVYNHIYESLQEKVNSGELSLEEAELVNEAAYNKYCNE